MKPDGVATAALDQMEAQESNPVTEAAPATGQELDQAASPLDEGMELQPSGDTEAPAAKNSSKTIGDPKAKAPNKVAAKTKPGTTTPGKTTPGSKPTTPQSRLSNGVSKPQTNGIAKKATPSADKKSVATSATSKKPTGTTGTPASKTATAKGTEKKATGTAPVSTKPPTRTTAAAKKATPSTANGVKSTTATATAAAKKPAGQPPTGTAASPRPSTGSTRPNTSSTTKSSTPKTPSSAAKPSAPKSTPTTPSGGKTPASQTARSMTPAKKDVTKPATSVAKKPSESALSRPPATSKSAKPETSKSASKADITAKKPAPKSVDTKPPSRSKPQESKSVPSKDASKTPGSKSAPTKASGPKKTVGSTTPTAVKRTPKAMPGSENGKETAAVVAAVAAIAASAAAIASAETSEVMPEKGPELKVEPILVSVVEPTTLAVREPTPEPVQEPTPEPLRKPTPEPLREPTPEPSREPTPEPLREPTPEPLREPTPEPLREPTPEPQREPSPEPLREPSPEPHREPTPEPIREPTPEPQREPTPEPQREPTPEPLREPSPVPVGKLTPEPVLEPSPSPLRELTPEPTTDEVLWSRSEPARETAPSFHLSAQMDSFKFEEPANDSVPALGTTVMSPPCSPPGLASPIRETHGASSIIDMHVQPDPWDRSQTVAPSDPMGMMKKKDKQLFKEEEEEEEEEDEEEEERANLFMSTSTAPPVCNYRQDDFTRRDLMSPSEKEEAVEKADQEINDDDDDEEEEEDDDEEEEHRRHLPSSLITDMSMSQPSEELQVRSSAFGGSAGWHGDDLDSEDVSSCTSSRQQGVSDFSSTLHTEDERVDEMELSSERVEEHPKAVHDDEDEDVEMHSEGVTEGGENAEEDDFNEEQCIDNLNVPGGPPCAPPASSWSQSNPFSDTWTQPTSALSFTSPSPLSDHGAADSETPTQSPARPCLDIGASSFTSQSEQIKDSSPEEDQGLPAVHAAREGQPTHSGSESSTPEDLRDYDSSSGVESRSDKQHTPVPAAVQPDMDQDLGIHLEKGDGEEEEAETLPADEVLGTGPPTAPASAPSSASTSGDEASDTEGEIQINDPDAPMMMDESTGFESPPPAHSLSALEEDEEVVAEEDGGGATPQSANSVASYGLDCTTSNSNAHSMAESCGKSPGIFSLENEEQFPDEAKDPLLIQELTFPSATASAQVDELLGLPVDLLPLGGNHTSMVDHHYVLGEKMAAEYLEEAEPLKPQESEGMSDSQPPYYSAICDKTDSFLEGNKSDDGDEDPASQSLCQQDNQNQNHSDTGSIANGNYLALVPGNRRPIDLTLQLRRLEEHQVKLREMQHRQEQERQKRQWLEEERLRLEQQKQLEKQCRELLQLQLQQQQQEHRHRRQVLQWQLELEQQYRMHQKHLQQQQQQLRRSPTGVMVSPSSGLCTIYEAMETSDEEDDQHNGNVQSAARGAQRQLCPLPPQQVAWNRKVDMVQQLINHTLMLSGDGGCPPLLLLPVGGSGGTLSPLESSMWSGLLPQFSPPTATVTSVSSFSPDSRGSSPPGDWTVVEVETQH
uniref:BTB/POZ domain-containing protein n=1 Tax=Gouania willdenowi TaxID=441366 RepID=A0A8C5GSW0_GOUWI